MGRKAKFGGTDFLDAALKLVAEGGVGAATVSAIAEELKAPIGSVYHRFPTKEILLAELWLRSVESFQHGFLEALGRLDGLSAALHTPRWVRENPIEGKVLLVHRREELVSGDWPGEVREKAARLSRGLDEGIRDYARRTFGDVAETSILKTTFALIDVPYSATKRYLVMGKIPPKMLDKMIEKTFYAVIGGRDEDL
ncbi:MAG: helix-turn-helix transcriptional regulator [Deltaproteobacteria bacterium]|uniref:Helix-turn-helix transcriptional regulator n=1 Tax=Candidatus Zymogenus saltonus TaxID=2844893 RepID=A0A9D8KGG4_9DELT|nr:helix-turn-helix transcriptional regulator [Candidatus Zymogenus saltonus]